MKTVPIMVEDNYGNYKEWEKRRERGIEREGRGEEKETEERKGRKREREGRKREENDSKEKKKYIYMHVQKERTINDQERITNTCMY